MRRLENVRGEFSLTALAYNIRRAITLVGVPGLVAAARTYTRLPAPECRTERQPSRFSRPQSHLGT